MVKKLPARAGDEGDSDFTPRSGRFPWSRKWQPTPVFLPENFHGQRAWQAAVHEVTKGQTQPNTHTHTVIVVAAALAFCLLK